MRRDRPPERLNLPEPAATLWLQARDVLAATMPEREGWTKRIGGGTVLAARWGHRRSTDIDIVVGGTLSLKRLSSTIAKEIGGIVTINYADRIVVETNTGKLDVNRAPTEPGISNTRARISGRTETVLSTTQILRGKLKRALRRRRARDAYDIIRATKDEDGDKSLTSAYGLIDERQKATILTALRTNNVTLKDDADAALEPTEPVTVDLNELGTTAADVLAAHELERVRITLNKNQVVTVRETANHQSYKDAAHPDEAPDQWRDIGIILHLGAAGISIPRLKAQLDIYHDHKRSGLVLDTAHRDALERLDRLNQPATPSLKPTT